MKSIHLLYLAFSFLFIIDSRAQDKSKIKFGNVSPADFTKKVYEIDSNANAVVIADVGSSDFEGNSKGWFSLVHKHHKRIHILNKNGYDAADVSIYLYTQGQDEERLERLRAITYNLEEGKLVETKLEVKTNVFVNRINKNVVEKKFTFPNIKEGSIIEFEYAIVSDFLENLQPWEFQGNYPRIWSEYNVALPAFFNYVFLTQGYLKYDINDKKEGKTSYLVAVTGITGANDRIRVESFYTEHRWVIKNVPALKEETYTSSLGNHISKIEFQLSEFRPPLEYKSFLGSWASLSEDLLKAEHFGQAIAKDNGWLKDITSPLLVGSKNQMEKAKRIYSWVRDNLTCTDYDDVYLNQTLRNVVKTRNGSVAEINLLLTAMLRYADISTDPVLLSTRSHGFIYPLYPLMSRFNYVITRATIDSSIVYMDASEPRLGFGYLPLRCYNGQARIIDKEGSAVELPSDAVFEKRITTVFLVVDEKGKMMGSLQQTPGYYESHLLRKRINEKGLEELVNDIKKSFGSSAEISNTRFDSLNKFENEMAISYDFDILNDNGDLVYLNPMFSEGYKDNPFKSAKRLYPVEMPYTFDKTYNLQMEIPRGYEVDELPKEIIVKLNEENDGIFEYRISQSGSGISLRSRIYFKRSVFVPEEYEMLREFFNLIVKKHNEQIVFKKKK